MIVLPLRALFVLEPALNPMAGGVQASTVKISKTLVDRGYSVSVFSYAQSGHIADLNVKLIHPELPGGSAETRNHLSLRKVLEDIKPHVVINQMPYNHDIGLVLKENKNYLLLGCLRNTLYSVKGDLEGFVARTAPGPLKHLAGSKAVQQGFLAIHRRRHRADLLKILDSHDYFVMFGEPNLEELRYFVPEFREEQVRLIPNSIPHVCATVPLKHKRLLWLGRVANEQKRADLILPIWERVSRGLPDWELDVVGDGPLLDVLKAEAVSKSLSRVNFYGRQPPDDYYRRAAIFFMTSAFEGFPNTLVEAQSYGSIPVVFDSYPVARWIVDDGVNGSLVQPFEIEVMAQKIVAVARSPEQDGFAREALKSARRFHIDRVGLMWQQLFEAEVPKHSNCNNDEVVTSQ